MSAVSLNVETARAGTSSSTDFPAIGEALVESDPTVMAALAAPLQEAAGDEASRSNSIAIVSAFVEQASHPQETQAAQQKAVLQAVSQPEQAMTLLSEGKSVQEILAQLSPSKERKAGGSAQPQQASRRPGPFSCNDACAYYDPSIHDCRFKPNCPPWTVPPNPGPNPGGNSCTTGTFTYSCSGDNGKYKDFCFSSGGSCGKWIYDYATYTISRKWNPATMVCEVTLLKGCSGYPSYNDPDCCPRPSPSPSIQPAPMSGIRASVN